MRDYGYVSDLEYVHNYNIGNSPMHMSLATKIQGQKVSLPEEPNYLELGFGQGLSLNVHAAANKGQFWGNDFNPAQTANARELAEISGAPVELTDESFAEIAARDDLPEFDVIVLHGIWTWISHENREIIRDLVRRKLKIGGMMYVSYNAMPGWAASTPMRHLIREFGTRESSGALPNRLQDALAFSNSLKSANANYFKANPEVWQRWEQNVETQDKRYLAHEYLNENWDIFFFSEVADYLADAKLTFAASGHLLDLVDTIHITKEGQELLAKVQDPVLRQTIRDYLTNQQFRRDIYVKGERKMSSKEHESAMRDQLFVLTSQPKDLPKTIVGSLGEGKLNPDIYEPIISALDSDKARPKTLGELMIKKGVKDLRISQVVQALTILTSLEKIAPAQHDEIAAHVEPQTKRLNEALCERAETSKDVAYLASPRMGAGVRVDRIEQLFLRAASLKKPDPVAWVWSIFEQNNEKLLQDGKAITAKSDNIKRLRTLYSDFESDRLPMFKRIGIT